MTENCKQYYVKNYFKDIVNKYTLFFPIFLTALLFTLILLIDKVNLIGLILKATDASGKLLATFTVILGIICLVAFVAKFTDKKINLVDAVTVSVGAFSVIGLIYMLCTGITALRIIPMIIGLVFAIVFMFVRIHGHFNHHEEEIIYQGRASLYLKAVNKKFTFFAPLFVAFSGIVLTYYMERQNFLVRIYNAILSNGGLLAFSIILLTVFAVYVIIASFSKKSSIVDLIALSMFYYGIFLLSYIIVTGIGLRRGVVCASVFVISFIILLIRVLNFNAIKDAKAHKDALKAEEGLCPKTYFKVVAKKFEIILPVFIALIVAAFALVTVKFNILNVLGHQSAIVKLVFYTLYIAVAIAIVCAMVITLVTLKNEHIGLGDLILIAMILSAVAVILVTAITGAVAENLLIFLISITVFLYALVLQIIRINIMGD